MIKFGRVSFGCQQLRPIIEHYRTLLWPDRRGAFNWFSSPKAPFRATLVPSSPPTTARRRVSFACAAESRLAYWYRWLFYSIGRRLYLIYLLRRLMPTY